MTNVMRSSTIAAACLVFSTAASAQTPSTTSAQTAAAAPSSDTSTRPATTTFFGDTGIWYVPTGEVLANGKVSGSGYRRGTNWIQGYTNVGDFAGTFAVGIKDRAEVFGSFLFDTRIDRDIRPMFVNSQTFGGIIDRYPLVNRQWTGDNVGDFYLGAKVNIWSEYRQKPVALAIRAVAKLPTGDKDAGVSTGKTDVAFDFIASKEAGKLVDVSGYGGYEFRGSPDGFDAPSGAYRWGTGVAFPSRKTLRVSGEVTGEVATQSTITITGAPIIGTDLSRAPLVSSTEQITRATLGLTYQAKNGFFAGGGLSWNMPTRARSSLYTDEASVMGDYYDWQFRVGYHPGVRAYVAPAPAAPAVAATILAPQNRPPTVRARCEPCTVEVGKTSTVTADGQDPDGDTLTYRWSAPAGRFANQADRQTIWTAPMQEGAVPATVTADDGKGGTASASVTIQVTRPAPVVELNFEDVYFDFDRSTLRPEALRLLDDAVTRLQANAGKNIVIEGHTCSIGTAEYNLALGDRRANSVREYLMSRGVPASRMESRSYGEERPKFDNAREETRRLNRRAALVVKVQ